MFSGLLAGGALGDCTILLQFDAKSVCENGMTQEAMAEKVGLSARYVQSLEAGEYFPALPTLVKLREVLATTWDAFFSGL